MRKIIGVISVFILMGIICLSLFLSNSAKEAVGDQNKNIENPESITGIRVGFEEALIQDIFFIMTAILSIDYICWDNLENLFGFWNSSIMQYKNYLITFDDERLNFYIYNLDSQKLSIYPGAANNTIGFSWQVHNGKIPIGCKASPSLETIEMGVYIRVKYNPENPKLGYLPDNDGKYIIS